MSEAVLVLKDVSKTYASSSEKLTILRSVSFSVEAGKIVVITGESGCGKSTLLNLIGGLDTPSSGIIEAGRYQVGALSEDGLTKYRRNVLGLVFQFHYLLRDFTALENIMLPARIAGLSYPEAREKAESLITDVGLESRKNHYPTALSGGERQRIAVARALVNNPLLLLADEPTGNLDEGNSRMVEELLFSVVRKHGKTLLLVTHDSQLARKADQHYTLHGGELLSL
ncbi:MAG: ABC transporter ATP-binding protein [Spirochaetales bacterium]|jgi:lipoprotein-releasing system ATP-binding protein|nr:ABC transporter ATP-binding protein [Spirochaetales bacterium]